MQERLSGPSVYRGAEEAFDMFYSDRGLQDFLREYAKKEDIIESDTLKFTQAGENRKILIAKANRGSLSTKPGLFIGPRQESDSALVVYAEEADLEPGDNYAGFRLGEIRKNPNENYEIFVPEQTTINGFPIIREASYKLSQAPMFLDIRISKEDILTGLEKAVEGLI